VGERAAARSGEWRVVFVGRLMCGDGGGLVVLLNMKAMRAVLSCVVTNAKAMRVALSSSWMRWGEGGRQGIEKIRRGTTRGP
jgi:hypothetical protein